MNYMRTDYQRFERVPDPNPNKLAGLYRPLQNTKNVFGVPRASKRLNGEPTDNSKWSKRYG